MNQLPANWSQQIEAAYPKRSGPSGYRGTRLMLALRRALFESTWEQIIDGCKNYQAYCQAAGKEGTEYVQSPQRFIEDQSYLESFAFKAEPSKEERQRAEIKVKEAARWESAIRAAAGLREPIAPQQGECVAAFETRVRIQETHRGNRAPTPIHPSFPDSGTHSELSGRISAIADRFRVAK